MPAIFEAALSPFRGNACQRQRTCARHFFSLRQRPLVAAAPSTSLPPRPAPRTHAGRARCAATTPPSGHRSLPARHSACSARPARFSPVVRPSARLLPLPQPTVAACKGPCFAAHAIRPLVVVPATAQPRSSTPPSLPSLLFAPARSPAPLRSAFGLYTTLRYNREPSRCARAAVFFPSTHKNTHIITFQEEPHNADTPHTTTTSPTMASSAA